jgi:hypothetical protein
LLRFLSIVFAQERTHQLSILPDKDLVDLSPPIEPDQVTKNLTDTKSVLNSVINSQVMNCFSPHPTPYTLHPTPHYPILFKQDLV